MHKDSVYKSEYALMQSQAVAQERREMAQKHPVTTPNIQSHSFSMQVPPPPVPPNFPPKPPQTSPSTTKPSSPFYNPNIPPPRVMLSTPPPGPVAPPAFPPPLLHTIPPPAPLVLNEIPAPKALDLNAIPKPTLNLDAIKVPEFATAPPPPPPSHFPKGEPTEIVHFQQINQNFDGVEQDEKFFSFQLHSFNIITHFLIY